MQLTPASIQRVMQLPAGEARLAGELALPAGATGVVLLANGGSSHCSRDRHLARSLQRCGLGTLLLGLLTSEEDAAGAHAVQRRCDVALLAERLVHATQGLSDDSALRGLRLGYCAAGTASAAALVAAARLYHGVSSVVARDGRPDLAGPQLPCVTAATLFVVGGAERDLVELNEDAYNRLACTKRLVVVPGATRLLEEPEARDELAALAADWFQRYLETALRA